ncbi:MAG: replication-relaxation family protein [Actinomycetota bacterium]|nr:replication-relaxation family protein [Actinomycetota bacterium]
MSSLDHACQGPVRSGSAGTGSGSAGAAGPLTPAAGPSAPASPAAPASAARSSTTRSSAARLPSASVSAGGPAPSGAPHRLSPQPDGAPHRSGPSDTSRRGWRDLDSRLLPVLGRLTERDRRLCRLLEDHRVLTSSQVADVCFTGERRARMRLAELYALDVLDRFRPRRGGSPVPFHWVLGPLGAALVAAEHGVEVADVAWRRRLVGDLAASQRLAHLVGTNGFFCALARSARTRTGCRLEEWWSERRCAAEWGEVVRPDGYGVWTEHATSLPFLVEYDNGTERLERLGRKLDGYARLAAAAGHTNWVLFSFPSPRREAEARRVLCHPVVPVATTARAGRGAPDGPVWLPASSTGVARVRLVELAGLSLAGA